MSEVESTKARKAQCAQCFGLRNCDVLGHHQESDSDTFMSWTQHRYILRCRGCDNVFFQTSSSNSEEYDYYRDEHGDEQVVHHETVQYWPALLGRKRPDWLIRLELFTDERAALNDALEELYGALNSDLKALSAIGVRTSFDIAAELLGVESSKAFSEKLDALVAAGHIGIVDRDRLETLVDAGSASAHRGWKPTKDDLNVMLDVLEHFIHSAIIAPQEREELDKRAAAIKAKVPQRKKKTRAPTTKTAPSGNG